MSRLNRATYGCREPCVVQLSLSILHMEPRIYNNKNAAHILSRMPGIFALPPVSTTFA